MADSKQVGLCGHQANGQAQLAVVAAEQTKYTKPHPAGPWSFPRFSQESVVDNKPVATLQG